MGLNVQRLAVTSLSGHEREETRGFTRHTFERMDERVRPPAVPGDRYTWAPSVWCVLVKTEQRVVSHAGILYRVVQVGERRLAVGGIGSVMTLPDWRGRGYARAALKKAQAFVAVWLWLPSLLPSVLGTRRPSIVTSAGRFPMRRSRASSRAGE